MAEHLHLPCPAQKKEVAEGGIVSAINPHMKASLHELRAQASDDGSARVIIDIADYGREVALVIGSCYGVAKADGVVVFIIPKGLKIERKGGIEAIALLF